jgi:hypothetical protein
MLAAVIFSGALRRRGGTAIKGDDLKANRSATPNGETASGDRWTSSKRRRLVRVKSAKGNGWVRMLNIRKAMRARAAATRRRARTGLGRAGTGKVVATPASAA